MNFASRLASLHSAIWSYDRAYRLSWYVWPATTSVLVCGWIYLAGQSQTTSSSAPWGRPATSAKVRSGGGPDLDIWPETLRDEVGSCTTGNENWSARVEACSRLIESGLLNGWQLVTIYNQRGIHYAQTQPERALADYEAALKIRPQAPQVLMNRVNIYVARGQWEAAVADASKAIDMWIPELAARARVVRARAYYMLRDNDKAKADLDESQKVNADNPDAYLIRGNIDYDERRYAAAAHDFELYCKHYPHDPVGFIGHGMALEAESRFDEALLAYEIAIKLDPTDSRAVSGRDRAKHRQPCDSSLCWNQPKKVPGWQDTIGIH